MSGLTETAERLIRTMKHHYGGDQTLRPAQLSDFPHLDPGKYSGFQSEMTGRGFEWIADLESVEANSSPTSLVAPMILRAMRSADGSIVTAYFEAKPRIRRRLALLVRGIVNLRWWAAPSGFVRGLRTLHCASFETEFADGTFVTTSNAEAAAKVAAPPSIDRAFFPYDTPPQRLLESHRDRVAAHLAANPGARALAVRSLGEMIDMQQRQHRQRAAHRLASDWVSKAELRALARGNQRLADDLYAEVQRLLRKADA